MHVDAIIGLMRLSQDNNKTIGNMAKMVLGLVEGLQELEMRAGLSEAALEAERATVAELRAELARLRDAHVGGSPVRVKPDFIAAMA